MFTHSFKNFSKIARRQNFASISQGIQGTLSNHTQSSPNLQFIQQCQNIQHFESFLPRFYSTASPSTTATTNAEVDENQPVRPWVPSSLNVVIVGANGDLGRLLIKKFQPHVKSILGITSGGEFSPNQNRSKLSYPNVSYRSIDITDATLNFDFLKGADVVINASGTWIERDHTYKEIFVDGTKNLAFHSSRVGVKRFIQLGAMGSMNDSRSPWQSYKYKAEDMAFAAFPNVTIVRPGIMFGENATQFNHILNRLALCPIVPAPYSLVNVQPVWEDDVAEAIKKLALFESESKVHDTIWDLGGPSYYPVADLIKSALESSGKTRPVVSMYPVTTWVWDLILGITQMLPGAKIPRDYLTMMLHEWNRTQEHGWIVSGHLVEETDSHFTFKDLDMDPKSMEEILPTYYGSKAPVTTEKVSTP